jgi:2,3-bisphosphoglycerate-dependent phosphoglycerate mutase
MTGRTLLVPDTSGAPRRHESGSRAPRAAGTLWLVRHGESGWNVARRIQGQSPAAPGLTAAGRSQAAEAALELARRAPRASRIVASDLPRTAETAEIIAARLGLPVEFDAGLREQSLGVLEGRSAFMAGGADGSSGAAESCAAEGSAERDLLIVFWEDPFRTPPGGESVAEMWDRVHRALDRIAASHLGSDLIVVTHGGPVRVAAAAHPPEPGQAFPRTDVGNASITPYRPPARPSP